MERETKNTVSGGEKMLREEVWMNESAESAIDTVLTREWISSDLLNEIEKKLLRTR